MQSELEKFKYKHIKNLNTIIEYLNTVKKNKNEEISKKVHEIVRLTLFNFNSFKELYNIIYSNETNRSKRQNAVNEFLKLVSNPLLLEIYFTTHDNIGIELSCFCEILRNRYNNKTLYNAIDIIKHDLLNILLDLENTSNNIKIDDIKQDIIKILLH